MPSDIVTRLRADGVYGPTDKTLPPSSEAADEIERLRAEVVRLGSFLHPIGEEARRG